MYIKPISGEVYPYNWSLLDVNMEWPYGYDCANLFLTNNPGLLFVIPIGKYRFRLIANIENALSLLPEEAKILETYWKTDFKVSLRQVKTYQQGRAYLAGDAAHIHSPAGG